MSPLLTIKTICFTHTEIFNSNQDVILHQMSFYPGGNLHYNAHTYELLIISVKEISQIKILQKCNKYSKIINFLSREYSTFENL